MEYDLWPSEGVGATATGMMLIFAIYWVSGFTGRKSEKKQSNARKGNRD